MIFGEIPLDEAEGRLLAHSLRTGTLVFKKGRRLSAEDIAALRAAGVSQVTAAGEEPGEVHEDAAAQRLAKAITGEGAVASAAFTGRCNLIAERRGLAVFDAARLQAINRVDEALTLASLPQYAPVEPRQMLATVKVIPFVATEASLARCLEIAEAGQPLVRVAAFSPRPVALIQSELPGLKVSVLDKTKTVTDGRLAGLGCPPSREYRCPHSSAALAETIGAALTDGAELVLVSGASAIVDRRDVVPAGMVAAGATIEQFGMPVDPGNLLLLARKDAVPLLGLPGCARSPKPNGVDWVLQRLIADLPLGRDEIMGMGLGGLLKETARPLPRARAVEASEAVARAPRIGAVVLAAGQSRRMGAANKLLSEVRGQTMVRRAVRAAKDSQAAALVVVTGHEREAVGDALAELAVDLVHNPDYAKGLSTSLHRGLAALPAELDGAVVLLGDMPRVSAAVVDRLIAAFDPLEGRAICLPTWRGKRGNPVLFARQFFAEVQEIAGDVGAKPLLAAYPELVAEVAMDDDAVLRDVDTPEDLAEESVTPPES
jgi:molybdenum cofactor cytidylyltransferase